MTEQQLIETPHGPARLVRDRSRHPIATLLLGHGAGGGIESPDLAALARQLPRHGVSVVRVEQPWRVAGKRVASRPEVLDECFVAVANKMRVRTPLVVGGRSAGARSAARTARELGASGYLARCTRRAAPNGRGWPSWRRSPCRRWSCRGSATRSEGPRSSRPTAS
jgi:hypothetical protein